MYVSDSLRNLSECSSCGSIRWTDAFLKYSKIQHSAFTTTTDASNAIIRMVTCSRVQMSTAPRHPNNQHASGPAHGLCNSSSSNWHYPFRSQFAGRNTRTWSFQRNIKCLYVHMTCWRTEDHFKIIISSGFVRYISHRIKASISIPGKQKVFLIAPCPPVHKARNRTTTAMCSITPTPPPHTAKKRNPISTGTKSVHIAQKSYFTSGSCTNQLLIHPAALEGWYPVRGSSAWLHSLDLLSWWKPDSAELFIS